MFDLTIRSEVYLSWNESARSRVIAGLAFLPADFERVVVSLEYVPRENSEQWQYCCEIRAKETRGDWHVERTLDFDAYQALEHAIYVIARSVLSRYLDNTLNSREAGGRRPQIIQSGNW